MSATIQLEELTGLHDAPRLLVEWSSPWEEFVTSIRPALARSDPRLAGEAPFGLQPLRNWLAVCAAEAFVVFLAIIIPIKLDQLHPYIAPKLTGHDIIYYSGDELPRTEDLGGAHAGSSGNAGGTEAHHRTQTIKVARGGSLVEKVLDAPRLKLPPSPAAVANLLTIRPDAGPPPAEGLRSARRVANLPPSVIAPVPTLSSEVSRTQISSTQVSLGSVIAPAPSVSRDRVLIAPALNTSIVAPAPTISGDRSRSAPLIATNVVPPAPEVARDRTPAIPSLRPAVVAPAPALSRDTTGDQARSAPALNQSVIPPAPAVSRDVPRSPVQMANAAVVPPPVSAPERESTRNLKLTLPAPSVVTPPPSADLSQDLHRLASGGPDLTKSVVPPPPTPTASTSFMTSLIDRVFGSTSGSSSVVAPPPTVSAASSSRAASASLTANVVPPPPVVSGTAGTSLSAAKRPDLASHVVPPPPSAGTLGGRSAPANPTSATAVVPPPPSLSASSGNRGSPRSALADSALTPKVVPPPPSLGKGDALAASGRSTTGLGLGGSMDAGSVVAPPRNAGSGGDSGVVVSKDPGPKVGLPVNAHPGSLAMSPAGGDKPGVGSSGGGSALVRGEGPGSAMNGAGEGGGKSGIGHGSDPAAKAGISPTPGPGGAGNATSGTPAVAGVSVAGGSSTLTVDFGTNIGSGDPRFPGRSSANRRQSLGVTVQSTASSGGAFDFYHLMPGATHDLYIDTSPLPAVMRYSDPASVSKASGTLEDPEPLHTDLPAGLPHARLVITCVLDASGSLKNLHVYEAGPADMTAKVMAALPGWKFSPVMIGNQPVEVNAILGFNIDTNDPK